MRKRSTKGYTASAASKPLRISTHLLPSPRKIAQRGLYEMMWGCGKEDYKPRDYGKRLKKGKY